MRAASKLIHHVPQKISQCCRDINASHFREESEACELWTSLPVIFKWQILYSFNSGSLCHACYGPPSHSIDHLHCSNQHEVSHFCLINLWLVLWSPIVRMFHSRCQILHYINTRSASTHTHNTTLFFISLCTVTIMKHHYNIITTATFENFLKNKCCTFRVYFNTFSLFYDVANFTTWLILTNLYEFVQSSFLVCLLSRMWC